MKNLSVSHRNPVFQAGTILTEEKGIQPVIRLQSIKNSTCLKIRLLAIVLLSFWLSTAPGRLTAQGVLNCIHEQNGKTAKITATICPYDPLDFDFEDPIFYDRETVGLQSFTKNNETINGVTCRKMIVQVLKKKPGNTSVRIQQRGDSLHPTVPEDIEFNLCDDLFSMSVPNHVNDGSFITSGFHPGQVINMALKIIDTETGAHNSSATGTAFANIIGNGFTFNGGAMAQTVFFTNGISNITIHALNPNSAFCYFRISDDTLPNSIGGSSVLHTAMISLTPPPVSVSCQVTPVSCGGTNDGAATVSVTGGTSPFLYSFSTGISNSPNPTVSALEAGSYTAMVTDFYGNTVSKSFIIPQTNLTIGSSVSMPFCSGNSGNVDLSVSGTAAPLSYLWSNGATIEDLNNLLPGIFTVTVSGNPGCSGTATFDLTTPNTAPEIIFIPDTQVSMLPGKNYALVEYSVSASDECPVSLNVTSNPPSGSAFYKGITTVTCMATDVMGLSSIRTFTVIVTDDEAPVAHISDTTASFTSNGMVILTPSLLRDSSSDNCGILTNTVLPASLGCANIGTTAVTSTVTDGNNNYWIIDSSGVKYFNNGNILISTHLTTGKVSVIVTSDGGFIVIDDGRVRKYDKDGNLQSTIFTSGDVRVIVTSDGGFIVIDDGRVRKYDKDGNLQSTIFTTGEVKVITTADGGFIVIDAGRVRKYDKNGNLQSTIFTSGEVRVITTSDGGFIVIDDGRVRKYDKDGNLQSTIFTTGEVKVITTSDGGFIVIDAGRVRKYDKNGNLQSTIFTSGEVRVITTGDGGFIVIDDGRVRKYDKDGNLQSTIFTTGEVKVITTSDGGFIVVDAGRVRKYDKDGNLQSTIFTSGEVRVITTGDGGFIVIDDGRVRKYDKDGNLQSTIFTTCEVKVITTSDGGFIVVDAGRVRKYDKDGNLQSTIFTSGEVRVITTSDGGFIVIDDGRVRRYDKNGNLLSTIFTTGTVNVITTSDGGFIVIDDGRVRKYDAAGNLQSTIFTSGPVRVVADANGGFKVIDDGRIRVYDTNGNLLTTVFTSVETYAFTNQSLYGTDSSLVTVLNPINVTGIVTPVNCSGKKTGKITLTVSGSTGPYTYLWSNGKTTKNLSGLAAGTYTGVVTDANGCSKSITFTVSQPAALLVTTTKTTVKCNGAATGAATATASGGTAPYSYSWNTVPVKTGATATGLAAGSYIVTVTDANGCTKTKSVAIIQNQPITVTFQPSFNHATAVAAGGVGPYTYKWFTNPVQTTATATGLVCGSTYQVKVTDSKGCTKSVSFTLTCPRQGESPNENSMQVNVFPNPTSGMISIAVTEAPATGYSLELVDATGRMVHSTENSADADLSQLDLSGFADGVYSLRIRSDNQLEITRIILQRNR